MRRAVSCRERAAGQIPGDGPEEQLADAGRQVDVDAAEGQRLLKGVEVKLYRRS